MLFQIILDHLKLNSLLPNRDEVQLPMGTATRRQTEREILTRLLPPNQEEGIPDFEPEIENLPIGN